MYAIRSYYVGHLFLGVENAGLAQQLVHQRGLAVVDVRDDVITSYSIHYTKLYDGSSMTVTTVRMSP